MAKAKTTPKKASKKASSKKVNTKKAEVKSEPAESEVTPEVKYQLKGLLLGLAGFFLLLSVYTSAVGRLGEAFRSILGILFGGGAFLFPFWFIGVAIFLYVKKGINVKYRTIVSALLLLFLSSLIHAFSGTTEFAKIVPESRELVGGGLLGGSLYLGFRAIISKVGAILLLVALTALSLIILTNFSFKSFFEKVTQEKEEDEFVEEKPSKKKNQKDEAEIELTKAPRTDFPIFEGYEDDKSAPKMRMRPLTPIIDIPLDDDDYTEKPNEGAKSAPVFDDIPDVPEEEEFIPMDVEPSVEPPKEEPKEEPKPKAKEKSEDFVPDKHVEVKYITPPITLLNSNKGGGGLTQKDIKLNSQKLVDVLQSFGVMAKVIGASVGPTVTRYEIIAASGTKVSKIANLSEDIALHMGVSGIRIAPVPERSAIGIEVPNNASTVVSIRECIESPEFSSAKSKLAFTLGKGISGKVIISNIAKMPHLLIAGATGSGKSVCINTIVLSILFNASPSEVKLLMIDPKVVELKVYNGIPHLISPVVTDPKKAANALNWAVSEMSRRYKVFAEVGVRNIDGFNEYAKKVDTEKPMERIVIIIDELADLMMAAPNDVESAIQRITQLARAAGIHLIVATQRPSVNVITGVIKANIPSRIAFAVSSQIDSRTILDVSGAEKLLGKGDMLYHPQGAAKPTRVQGSFVSDEEVEKVVDFVKNNSDQVQYNEEAVEFIKKEPEEKGKDKNAEEEEDIWDIRLPEAVDIVMNMGSASTSMLQRKMGVGYARAARMVDQLEQQGIVGPPDGSKPREILMTRQEYLEMMNFKENVQSNMDEMLEEEPHEEELAEYED